MHSWLALSLPRTFFDHSSQRAIVKGQRPSVHLFGTDSNACKIVITGNDSACATCTTRSSLATGRGKGEG